MQFYFCCGIIPLFVTPDVILDVKEHQIFEKRYMKMKDGIHPTYEDATITCACRNVIKTRSTKKEMQVNTCSACHPYFTGQKTMVDTEGRVDSFKKRYAKFQKKA